MGEASIVFRGSVLDRKTLPLHPDMRGRGRYATTFRVDEYWKGPVPRTITIYGMDDGTDCQGGSFFQVGKSYLVYAGEGASKDVKLDDYFWYGWTDVLPEGTEMLFPLLACSPAAKSPKSGPLCTNSAKGRVRNPRANR